MNGVESAGRLERFARSAAPPGLILAARRLRHAIGRFFPRLREWEYVPEGWDVARSDPRIEGWDVPGVVDAYRAKLAAFRQVVEGPGIIAVPTTAAVAAGSPSVQEQNAILTYGYALSLASRKVDRVSILDWGGGIGVHYLLARALLPPEVDIEFHCKEMPMLCRVGGDELPSVRFHDDESCLERAYDLVLASSSLQYSEHWPGLLRRLSRAAAGYLLLTRVPVVLKSRSFVVRQRAYAYGFDTEYLSWVFNRDELVDSAAEAGMKLVREFLLGARSGAYGTPEQDETRGFLFRAA